MSDRIRTVWDDPLPRRERNRLVTDCAQAMREQYRPENDAPEDEREAWRRIRYDAAKRLFRDEGETMIDQRVRLADEARDAANHVQETEIRIVNLHADVLEMRRAIAHRERDYWLDEYPGKTKEMRDAQREEQMDGDPELIQRRDDLTRTESLLAGFRIDRDHAERTYRIALAELRVLGTER